MLIEFSIPYTDSMDPHRDPNGPIQRITGLQYFNGLEGKIWMVATRVFTINFGAFRLKCSHPILLQYSNSKGQRLFITFYHYSGGIILKSLGRFLWRWLLDEWYESFFPSLSSLESYMTCTDIPINHWTCIYIYMYIIHTENVTCKHIHI